MNLEGVWNTFEFGKRDICIRNLEKRVFQSKVHHEIGVVSQRESERVEDIRVCGSGCVGVCRVGVRVMMWGVFVVGL